MVFCHLHGMAVMPGIISAIRHVPDLESLQAAAYVGYHRTVAYERGDDGRSALSFASFKEYWETQ